MPITSYTKAQIDSTASSTTSGASKVGVSGITGLLSGAATNVQAALAGLLALMVPTTRNINTTSGHLTGGGDLSADRTLGLPSVVSAGSATLASVTVDAQGRVTSLSSGSSGAVADASTTVKGASKVSVAPVSSTNPIAVGDNDPRLSAYYKWFHSGSTAATVTGKGWERVLEARTLVEIGVELDVAPTVSTTVAIMRRASGGSATQIATCTISSGSKVGSTTGLSVALSAGDGMRVDVTSGGTTGSDLFVVARAT